MFCITATFSLFAYIWLVIVLVVSSPNKVDVWEAVLTFLFFPLLVCIAYAGDKGFLNKLLGVKKTEAGEAPEQVELGEGKILLFTFLTFLTALLHYSSAHAREGNCELRPQAGWFAKKNPEEQKSQ